MNSNETFQSHSLTFFSSIEEGIQKIQHLLEKTPQNNKPSITYVCSNFNDYLKMKPSNNLINQILSLLKEKSQAGIPTKVHSYCELNKETIQENIPKTYYLYYNIWGHYQSSLTPKDKSIQVFTYEDKKNSLTSFITALKKLAKENHKEIYGYDREFHDLTSLAENLLFNPKRIPKMISLSNQNHKEEKPKATITASKLEAINERFFTALDEFANHLINEIKTFQESRYHETQIKPKIPNELHLSFANLKNNLKHSIQEGEEFFLKEIIKFLITIVDFTDIQATFKHYALPLVLLEVAKVANHLYKYSKDQFLYPYLLPLQRILSSQIGMYLNLYKTNFYSHFFIINEEYLVDFSGFSLFNSLDFMGYQKNKGVLYKGLGFLGIIKDKSPFLPFLQSSNTKAPTPSFQNHCIAKLESGACNDDLLRIIAQKFEQSTLLNYIEYPSFSSSLLGEILQNRNHKTFSKSNPITNPNAFNYLVITNAPPYESSGLESEILEHYLDYKIQSRAQAKEVFGSYNPELDYSHYCITRNDNPIFLLRLSPFVCLKKEEYDSLKELASHPLRFSHNSSPQDFEEEEKINAAIENARNILAHIHSFFKQPKEIQEITQKGEEIFKEFIQILQSFLKSFHSNKATATRLAYSKEDSICCYSLIDIVLIALCFQTLKTQAKNYGINYQFKTLPFKNSSYHAKPQEIYQSLLLDKEVFMLIPQQVYLQIDSKNQSSFKRIFLNQEIKEKLAKDSSQEEYLLIEDFLEEDFLDLQSQEEIAEEIQKDLQEDFGMLKVQSNAEYITQEEYQKIKNDFDCMLQDSSLQNDFTEYHILQKVFEEFIFSLIPFMEYPLFHQEDILQKILVSILKQSSLKEILKEELGLAYLAILGKNLQTKHTTQEIMVKKSFQILLQNQHSLMMLQRLKTHTNPLQNKIKVFQRYSKDFLISYANTHYKHFLQEVGKGIFLDFIDKKWQTHYEKLKKEYETLMFSKFTYKYNEPYATQRKHFITYPMSVQSNFMCFDFMSLFYGGQLRSGGLGHHLGFAYWFDLPYERLCKMIVDKILSYLVLDHHRHQIKIQDYLQSLKTKQPLNTQGIPKELETFFIQREWNNPRYYKLSIDGVTSENTTEDAKAQKELYDLFKGIEQERGDKTLPSAIDAYNEALDILEDILKGHYQNKKNQDDTKTRRLLECLEIIGQNNIKAMYVGIKEESGGEGNQEKEYNRHDDTHKNQESEENKERQPYFIGRLATTIIREGGLWLG